MRNKSRRVLLACAAAACVGLTGHARAHDPGMSSLGLTQRASRGGLMLVVENADLPEARRAGSRPCIASNVFAVALDGRALAVDVTCRAPDPNHTEFVGSFALSSAGQLAIAVPLLAELPRGHRSFARARDGSGRTLDQRLLERGDRWQLAVKAPPRRRTDLLALVGVSGLALAAALLRAAGLRSRYGASRSGAGRGSPP